MRKPRLCSTAKSFSVVTDLPFSSRDNKSPDTPHSAAVSSMRKRFCARWFLTHLTKVGQRTYYSARTGHMIREFS